MPSRSANENNGQIKIPAASMNSRRGRIVNLTSITSRFAEALLRFSLFLLHHFKERLHLFFR